MTSTFGKQGLYPDALKVRVPRGYRDQVKEAAAQEGVSAGELVRRAICQFLNESNRQSRGYSPTCQNGGGRG